MTTEPGFDSATMIFERLLEERIVLLWSALTPDVAARVSAGLLLLAERDPKSGITLQVNCQAGDTTSALAVLDTMNFVGCDVSTVAIGAAAGVGQLLVSGGARGKRYALLHARIALRQPDAGRFEGRASEIAVQAEQALALKRRLAELNAGFTGRPVEQIEADSERETWFTPAEAVGYGLIDTIVTSADDA